MSQAARVTQLYYSQNMWPCFHLQGAKKRHLVDICGANISMSFDFSEPQFPPLSDRAHDSLLRLSHGTTESNVTKTVNALYEPRKHFSKKVFSGQLVQPKNPRYGHCAKVLDARAVLGTTCITYSPLSCLLRMLGKKGEISNHPKLQIFLKSCPLCISPLLTKLTLHFLKD